MIGIIGGGISGLTTAYYLQKAGKECVLFEASSRTGGSINTIIDSNNKKRELGPNTILEDKYVKNLIDDLAIENEVVEANPISKDRFILKGGKIKKLPSNPIKFLSSTFFSWNTKREILSEFKKPVKNIPNETVKDFFIRRFNQEVYNYAVNPFVSGIFAGDPSELILKEAFPTLKDFEQKHGSVLKGFAKNKSKNRKRTITFKSGLSYLTDTLSKEIKNIHLNSVVNEIVSKENNSYLLKTEKGEFSVTSLVLAIPTIESANILSKTYPVLSEKLHHINYPPMTVVHTTVNKSDIETLPSGFGMLHPKKENCFSAGTVWNSSIFPDNKDTFTFTSFVGGSQYIENTQFSDSEIKKRVLDELSELYNISKNKSIEQQLFRWEKSIPQYDSKLSETTSYLSELEKDNIFICTNWYKGISLPSCIKKGKELALKLEELH